ncbi:phosphonate-binding periplasmic protein [Magnetococcus marinus MC-1]|uniref:Phosphonate-binding periplasmic protein n=1 Tax=Magnetococcus marinus (strain ATCC BAA-1437 / JCM 17883 / MC-1) TaxID=156889 RepID=A0L8N4_MAGMM|nr:phosphate/phosphite/phosphonate ABC transporter substrate-binding protein [Magnetococcus marinus]ABK44327.1 phosphonate-binding periplasmic protein [Magnetococcus marinus MC-1]
MRVRKVLQKCILLVTLTLFGCQDERQGEYTPLFSDTPTQHTQRYIFGVHPLHNPERLFAIYQPLVDYLNLHLHGVRIILEASRNYAAYDKKLFAGYFHMALPNPYQTVTALEKGYRVFGKMGDDHNFRGILLVRKDKNIRHVTDLKGQVVSYPAPTALAATMLPQWFLHTHGVDVLRDIQNRYVGSQESSIMNVYLGESIAGATWPPPWRAFAKERPEIAQELEVKWSTMELPNNGLVMRDDVPAAFEQQIALLIFALHTHAEGKAILAPMELSRFEPAVAETYRPVQAFLQRFEAEVRPIRESP